MKILPIFLLLCSMSVLTTSTIADTINTAEWPITDFSRHTVDMSEIISGGPTKDGIPPIDRPKFATFTDANNWLAPKEPVIVLEINQQVRAYPIQILIFHEIVNDTLGGMPVSVTFCPLCNAAIVFQRKINGRILDFGTTGRLRKSDMIMYDRQTQSWWQQFLGEGIVGEFAGKQLKQMPATIVSYQEYKAHYPGTKVLSRDTGYTRPYGQNPYRGYDSIEQRPFLFQDPLDPRLPAMERVIGLLIKNKSKIYPLSVLQEKRLIHDNLAGIEVVVLSASSMRSPLDKSVIRYSREIPSAKVYQTRLGNRQLRFEYRDDQIFDVATGSSWNIFGKATSGPLKGKQLVSADAGVHFAFAWLAFRPESLIYRSSSSEQLAP